MPNCQCFFCRGSLQWNLPMFSTANVLCYTISRRAGGGHFSLSPLMHWCEWLRDDWAIFCGSSTKEVPYPPSQVSHSQVHQWGKIGEAPDQMIKVQCGSHDTRIKHHLCASHHTTYTEPSKHNKPLSPGV